MKARLLMYVLWPAFLTAGIAEGILFTLVDPADLSFFGEGLGVSRISVYSVGFLVLWMLCALSSMLSIYLLPGAYRGLDDEHANSLV